MTEEEKLNLAMDFYTKFGVDPDQIMMLTPDEADMAYGDGVDHELIEQIEKLNKERNDLISRCQELEEEEIPEFEALYEDSTGEARSEYRSELASARHNLERNHNRLIEVNQLLRGLYAKLRDRDEEKELDDPEEEVLETPGQISIFDMYLTQDDLVFKSDKIEELTAELTKLGRKIDYLVDTEIPLTEKACDEARDYYRRKEMEDELREVKNQLSLLKRKYAEIEAKIEEVRNFQL